MFILWNSPRLSSLGVHFSFYRVAVYWREHVLGHQLLLNLRRRKQSPQSTTRARWVWRSGRESSVLCSSTGRSLPSAPGMRQLLAFSFAKLFVIISFTQKSANHRSPPTLFLQGQGAAQDCVRPPLSAAVWARAQAGLRGFHQESRGGRESRKTKQD